MAKQRFMAKADVIEQAVTYFPSFLRSRKQALALDAWMNGEQYGFSEDNLDENDPAFGRAFQPNKQETTREYENLRGLSPNNFAGLIVTTLAQTAYVEGIRKPGILDTLPIWETFMRNRWGSKQTAVHRASIGHGVAYGTVLPGKDPLTGSPMSKMSGKSAMTMAAFYQDDDDEWATLAIEAYRRFEDRGLGNSVQVGWTVRLWDDYVVHNLTCEGDGKEKKDWTYISHDKHGMPVPPIARCANRMDLDGRTQGEIEPVLPLLRRIDQDTFDRLINQRFGAWQVRYIAGMAKPDSKSEQALQGLKLRTEDLLVSTSHETKFGVLPSAPLEPNVSVTEADLRLLSAIAQIPPHHLLGVSSNLQAEALVAATEGLMRKSFDFRTNAGEFHEQMARLVAMAEGDLELAGAWDLQIRWRDPESISMTQAADALGKLAVQLHVPVEMLWERIPGWSDTDVERAKELVENGSLDALLAELAGEAQQQQGGAPGGNAE